MAAAVILDRLRWPHAFQAAFFSPPGGAAGAHAENAATNYVELAPLPGWREFLPKVRGDAGLSIHGIVWPISRSMASTYLVSIGATMVKALPERPGPAGAADAVDIVFGVDRHVVVEDVADVGDVEAARRDVGGDQELQLAVAETGEQLPCARAGPCRHAARRRRNRASAASGTDRRLRPCGCRR